VEIDEQRILYTGDFKLRRAETAEPAEVRRSDVLVMKCIYGLPKYIFPPPEGVIDSLIAFIDESLSHGLTPILLVDAMGKAQDIVKILGDMGYKFSLYRSIYKAIKVYEEFGIQFANYESLKTKRAGRTGSSDTASFEKHKNDRKYREEKRSRGRHRMGSG
jgi:Predicted exonuclease of the beta-lactamase fold involved in RNA processing